MCVQTLKWKETTGASIIRKLLTFISSMLYTLHDTRGDVLLVVLVNLKKKKIFRKVDFPGFPWAIINADQKAKGWWCRTLSAWTQITIYSLDQSLITLLSWQPTSKTHKLFWGPNTSFTYSKMKIFFYCNVLFKLNVIHNSEFKPTKDSPLTTVEKLHLTFGAAWIFKKCWFQKGKFSKYKHQVLK